MTESQLQSLSALLDDELDAEQTDALVDALCRDDDLAAEWGRMHRVRSLLRGEDMHACDVTAAVHAALAAEPTYLLPVAPRPVRHWPRYAIGGALAASVALLTVAGLRPWQDGGARQEVAQVGTPQLATGSLAMVTPAAVVQVPNGLQDYRAAYEANALFAGQNGPVLVRDASSR